MYILIKKQLHSYNCIRGTCVNCEQKQLLEPLRSVLLRPCLSSPLCDWLPGHSGSGCCPADVESMLDRPAVSCCVFWIFAWPSGDVGGSDSALSSLSSFVVSGFPLVGFLTAGENKNLASCFRAAMWLYFRCLCYHGSVSFSSWLDRLSWSLRLYLLPLQTPTIHLQSQSFHSFLIHGTIHINTEIFNIKSI